jgi:hypothetical protein
MQRSQASWLLAVVCAAALLGPLIRPATQTADADSVCDIDGVSVGMTRDQVSAVIGLPVDPKERYWSANDRMTPDVEGLSVTFDPFGHVLRAEGSVLYADCREIYRTHKRFTLDAFGRPLKAYVGSDATQTWYRTANAFLDVTVDKDNGSICGLILVSLKDHHALESFDDDLLIDPMKQDE